MEEEDRILVVAPHPDDESIGCGGLLSLYPGQCDVLLVTDGLRRGGDFRLGELRLGEFIAAADVLGLCQRTMLHIFEEEIDVNFHEFMKYDFSIYRYILVPGRNEGHADHRVVFRNVKRALKKQNGKGELLEYEIWSTLTCPNVKVDFSSSHEIKRRAIRQHASQMKDLDYVEMALGLNAYRGQSRGCAFAEMYYSEMEAKRQRVKKRKSLVKGLWKLFFS